MADTMKVIIRFDEWWPMADVTLFDADYGYAPSDAVDAPMEKVLEYNRLSARVKELSGEFLELERQKRAK